MPTALARTTLTASAFLAAFLAAAPAAASGAWSSATVGPYVSAGGNVGAELSSSSSTLAGGEVSLGYVMRLQMRGETVLYDGKPTEVGGAVHYLAPGVFGDCVRVFALERARCTAGAQLAKVWSDGLGGFGLDAGLVLDSGRPATLDGLRVRAFLSLAFFSPYVGGGSYFRSVPGERTGWGELGLLVKIPIPFLSEPPR